MQLRKRKQNVFYFCTQVTVNVVNQVWYTNWMHCIVQSVQCVTKWLFWLHFQWHTYNGEDLHKGLYQFIAGKILTNLMRHSTNMYISKQTKSFKIDATPPDTKGTYTVAPPTVVDLTLGPHYNNRSCKLAMVSYLNGCWPSMIMAIFINTLIPAFLIWFIESTGLSKNKQI